MTLPMSMPGDARRVSVKAPSVVVFDIGIVLIRCDARNLYRKLFAGDPAQMEWFLAHVCTEAWNLEQDRGRSFAEAIAERIAKFPEWEAQIHAYDERWSETLDAAIAENVTLLARLERHRARRGLDVEGGEGGTGRQGSTCRTHLRRRVRSPCCRGLRRRSGARRERTQSAARHISRAA
ncbi:MAG: hypothetical protein ACREFP_10235 [Acetobacteraceae bacterium]